MSLLDTDSYLRFSGVMSGGNLTVSGTATWGTASYNSTIFDDNSSTTLDAGDYYDNTGLSYTGYTMTIDGNDYAVFGPSTDGTWDYYIPYNVAIDDLSGLAGQSVTQSLVPSGDDPAVINCFLAGTWIETPFGRRRVEDLESGDQVATVDGRAVAVSWIARQAVMPRFRPAERLRVVRVRAGALGVGCPREDLCLTADHALVVDGLLVDASALVNGDSIDWMPDAELGDRYSVYHIETEAHETVIANGAPAETFLGGTGQGASEAQDTHAAAGDRQIAEMPLPRISSARLLPQGLRARLGISGADDPCALLAAGL